MGSVSFNINYKKTVICLVLASIADYCLAISKASVFAVILTQLLFLLLANISIKINEPWTKFLTPCAVVFTSVVSFLLAQYELDAKFFTGSLKSLLVNLFICATVILLSIIIAGRVDVGTSLGSSALMLFATIDYMVFNLRGSELTPFDFISLQTAFNVSGQYEFPVSTKLAISWTILLLLIIFLTDLPFCAIDRKKASKRIVASVTIMIAFILFLTSSMNSYRWGADGSLYRGFYCNFFLEVRESTVKKPEGYDAEKLELATAKYENKKAFQDERPNIIVIMNESFADFEALCGDFETREPVMPFYDSLDKEAIKGYAYTSVFGGGTSSSEFEFLTGEPVAFLPRGSIPYQQFIKDDTYTIVKALKNMGYITQAYHPYYASGWNRDAVYPRMGFDKSFFIEDFSGKDTIRGFVSDKEMYKMMIKRFNALSSNDPVFMFGVTIQNHGGYTEEGFDSNISISDLKNDYPETEQYLSLIKQSDDALQYLIKKLKKSDRKVILVFFGDHLPNVENEFYKEILGEEPEGISSLLSYQMKMYKVPFLIWANYDIDEARIDQTSLNYLSTYVFETAGIQTPFTQLQKDVSKEVPVITSIGYYSNRDSEFKRINDAEGAEKDTLDFYSCIQYNHLFDSKDRLDIFK